MGVWEPPAIGLSTVDGYFDLRVYDGTLWHSRHDAQIVYYILFREIAEHATDECEH